MYVVMTLMLKSLSWIFFKNLTNIYAMYVVVGYDFNAEIFELDFLKKT